VKLSRKMMYKDGSFLLLIIKVFSRYSIGLSAIHYSYTQIQILVLENLNLKIVFIFPLYIIYINYIYLDSCGAFNSLPSTSTYKCIIFRLNLCFLCFEFWMLLLLYLPDL
jgi:hypothetical protein